MPLSHVASYSWRPQMKAKVTPSPLDTTGVKSAYHMLAASRSSARIMRFRGKHE